MINNIETALNLIFEHYNNTENLLESLTKLVPDNNILKFEKNETIITQKSRINYLYFLISGTASVWGEISWTDNNIIEYLKPLEILGLIERLTNQNFYTAYVLAETDCVLFRVPSDLFINIIKYNSDLCFKTLSILSKITASNMEQSTKKSLFKPNDILGHYLYIQSFNKRPYTCSLTRIELADLLHINLRTLYRSVSKLQNNNYLIIKKGSIIIEENQFELLAEKYNDIML